MKVIKKIVSRWYYILAFCALLLPNLPFWYFTYQNWEHLCRSQEVFTSRICEVNIGVFHWSLYESYTYLDKRLMLEWSIGDKETPGYTIDNCIIEVVDHNQRFISK